MKMVLLLPCSSKGFMFFFFYTIHKLFQYIFFTDDILTVWKKAGVSLTSAMALSYLSHFIDIALNHKLVMGLT